MSTTQHLVRALCINTAILLFAVGCSVDGETDSETHWQQPLRHCEASLDCMDGLSCVCGLCTATCGGSNTCSQVSDGAACVTEPETVGYLCGNSDSPPGSICAAECTTANDCPGIQTCTAGYCESHSSIGDLSPFDSRCGVGSYPVCCPEEIRLDPAEEFGPSLKPPLSVRSPDFDPPTQTFSATWNGVIDAQPPSQLPCPAFASAMNVVCDVNYALSFSNPDFVAFVGLPRETLESLAEPGDAVRVTMIRPNINFRVEASDGTLLLEISDNNPDGSTSSPLSSDRGDYTFSMSGLEDDLSNVSCMTPRDRCRHEFVTRSLTLQSGGQTTDLPTNSIRQVTIGGAAYTVRHFNSHERLPLPEGGCASAYWVHLEYALVRAVECNSDEADACPDGFHCVAAEDSQTCPSNWQGTCAPIPNECDDPARGWDVCECGTSTSYPSACHARQAGYTGELAECP